MPETATACHKLKDMVYQFKEAMPIVSAFNNDKLLPRHWVQIKDILGRSQDEPLEERAFTLGDLVHMGVAEFQD